MGNNNIDGGNAMRSVVGQPMMGGKKRRSKKGGMSSSMRLAGGPSMMGGKTRRSKKSKSRRAHSSHRRTAKKGGMGSGIGAIIQEAIVPFGIFAWQKRSQKRR